MKFLTDIFLYKKTSPFSKFLSVVHNISAFPKSLWCMDACSVYKIISRKCRVSVNALCGQSSEGLTQRPQLFVLLQISSLESATCRLLNGEFHQRRLQTMLGDFWECSRVGCGGVGGCGRWDRPFTLSHWRSRRTGGSGVSARCRMTPYYHLSTGEQEVRSQRVGGVIGFIVHQCVAAQQSTVT